MFLAPQDVFACQSNISFQGWRFYDFLPKNLIQIFFMGNALVMLQPKDNGDFFSSVWIDFSEEQKKSIDSDLEVKEWISERGLKSLCDDYVFFALRDLCAPSGDPKLFKSPLKSDQIAPLY